MGAPVDGGNPAPPMVVLIVMMIITSHGTSRQGSAMPGQLVSIGLTSGQHVAGNGKKYCTVAAAAAAAFS